MTLNYNSAGELRAFLEQEGMGMQKKFGQNFLINPKTRQSLVDALGAQPGNNVWEIGPGLGAMTDLLLKNELKVKAFEIDNGFIRVLKKLFGENENFNLVEGDVLKTWKKETQNDSLNKTFLFGNLPYNIAAALLADFIEKGKTFSRIVVTVQKEVALRMAASAGSCDYSSFSVLCASTYKVKPLSVIKRESFYPQPNVDSMGVLLERLGPQDIPDGFYQLVRALFASRRKTIKNNLTGFLSSRFGKIQAQQLCADVLRENAISENERAENLEFNAFLSLAKSIRNVRL